MADARDLTDAVRNQLTALQDSVSSISLNSGDIPSRQTTTYDIAVRQLDDLKTKNIFNLDELEILQDQINHYLIQCNDHYRQITQYKLIFGAGNSRIFTCPDGSLNHHNSVKLDMATRLLDFDINRAKSLGDFYSAQKEFFRLIEKFKEVELEIQELLHGLVEHGITCQSFRGEMMESEGRMIIIEESRVTRMEGWLEWMDELL